MSAAPIASMILASSCGCVALAGCDESQVWHRPEWSLERMQEQPRVDPFDPQMSSPPLHTVAVGSIASANHAPPRRTREIVERGRSHFEVICAACHGIRGDGDSVVATKMLLRRPPSLLEPRIRALSDAQLVEIIGRGYGLMPPYANELAYEDRVATVAYLRALEVAEGIDVALLPEPVLADLSREAP